MIRVWQVTRNDTQLRFDWFVTKKEADAFVRETKQDWKDEEYGDNYTIDVKQVEFETGRKGLVDALNGVITMTCFNEG